MKPIPDMIHVQIVNADTNEPVSNIVIMVRLFAIRKNDYSFIPCKSNDEGMIQITKVWLRDQVKKEQSLFIMDYWGSVDQCKPKMEFRIMSVTEINNAIKGMTEWKDFYNISDAEIENLMEVNNANYKPVTQIIDFHREDTVTIKLRIKVISQGS